MRSASDPIRHLRALARLSLTAGGAAVVVAAWWAVAPLPAAAVPGSGLDEHAAAGVTSGGGGGQAVAAAIDPADFAVELWRLPPASVLAREEAAVEPPAPLPKLQLVGIIEEGGGWKAAIYDPETDRLLIVADGETVGPHVVERVTAERVVLRNGARTHALDLERRGATGRPASPGRRSS